MPSVLSKYFIVEFYILFLLMEIIHSLKKYLLNAHYVPGTFIYSRYK